MKIGVAVLGVGRWGVHLVRNFSQHPYSEIVAIADPSTERLNYCREQFDLDETKVILATEWESIRELENLHAVVIATPASTHYSLILDALKRGYHVLAEKPLTLNSGECLQLTALAKEKELHLLVDHTYLFNPAVQKGQQLMETGRLGELRYGYATRTNLGPVRQDVDALWDLAIHDIAIFNCWLGETPIAVQAKGSVWLQSDRKMAINYGIKTSQGLADLVWVTLTYPNGFQAYIHLCWLNPDKQRRLCIVGSQGTLIFDEMLENAALTFQGGCFEREGEKFIPEAIASEVIEIEKAEPVFRVCDRFLENIRTHKTCSIRTAHDGEVPSPSVSSSSGRIGAELVEILSCLSLSLEQQGETITVPRLLN